MALYPQLDDRAWLERRYLRDWAPLDEIADEAGCHVSTLHVALRRHEIPTRQAYDIPRAEVERMLADRATIREIAAHYDVHPDVIAERVYRWGLRTIDAGERELERVRQWYEQRRWSIRRIADKLGVTPRTATRMLIAAGATIRPRGRRVATD